MKSILSFLITFFTLITVGSQNDMELKNLKSTILDYHQGFNNKNIDLIQTAISIQLNMFNGQHSNNPINWEAHMFIQNDEILEWLSWMLENAGPFKNDISFKHHHIRGNSAIVVTNEIGSNKFRVWKNEEVVYQLGKISDSWKILSIYIKNLKNPE